MFHRGSDVLTLKEEVRSYNNLVEDTTRVMQRIKALFRARARLPRRVAGFTALQIVKRGLQSSKAVHAFVPRRC